jgi:hypothetical protein
MFSKKSRPAMKPIQPPVQRMPVFLSGVNQPGREVNHLHPYIRLVPRLRMSGVFLLLPLYTFMARTGSASWIQCEIWVSDGDYRKAYGLLSSRTVTLVLLRPGECAREFWRGSRRVTLLLVVVKCVVRMGVGSDSMEGLCICCVEPPLSANTVLNVVNRR